MFLGIFKLPNLIIETNSTYLVRNIITKLQCQVEASDQWENITLDRVYWMKDGVLVTELDNEEIADIKGM